MCKGPGVGRNRVNVQKGEEGAVSECEGCEPRMDRKLGSSLQGLSDPSGKVVFKAMMPSS